MAPRARLLEDPPRSRPGIRPAFPCAKVVQIAGNAKRRRPNAKGLGGDFTTEARGKGQGEITKNRALVDSHEFLQPPITVSRGRAQLSGENAEVSQGMASS